MSYKVKWEDIPADVMNECRKVSNSTSQIDMMDLADMIPILVEAGLVSPPCHVHRYLGELECQGGTLDPALFIGKPKAKEDEHWKGQTE